MFWTLRRPAPADAITRWTRAMLLRVADRYPGRGSPRLRRTHGHQLRRPQAALSLLSISVARWKYSAAKSRSFSCVNASLIALASNRHLSASDRRKIERLDMVAALSWPDTLAQRRALHLFKTAH